jgi:hypothetical protein
MSCIGNAAGEFTSAFLLIEWEKFRQFGMGSDPTFFQSLAVGSTAAKTFVMTPTVLFHRV